MNGKTAEKQLKKLLLEILESPESFNDLSSKLNTKFNKIFKKEAVIIKEVKDHADLIDSYFNQISDNKKRQKYWLISNLNKNIKEYIRNLFKPVKYIIPVYTTTGNICIKYLLLADKTVKDELEFLIIIAKYLSSRLTNDFYKTHLEKNKILYEIGHISNDIFHDIKNKLIAPSTFLQIIKTKYNDKDFRENFSTIALKELKSIENILIKFMQFGRNYHNEINSHTKETVKESIEYVIELLNPIIKKRNIILKLQIDPHLNIPLTPEILRDISFNLILNSIQALKSSEKKNIIIKGMRIKQKNTLTFFDNGIGIHKKNLKKIFEAFYSTKEDGNGLGLSMVKKEVELKNGSITIKSLQDTNTTITIMFNND